MRRFDDTQFNCDIDTHHTLGWDRFGYRNYPERVKGNLIPYFQFVELVRWGGFPNGN